MVDDREEEQGLYLAGSLNREFCEVLNDLSPSQRKEFYWLKAKLQQRFKPDQVGHIQAMWSRVLQADCVRA